MTRTVIATWFVADAPGEGTYFPQVGTTSDAPEAQAAYWRCTACFYASSLAVNPTAAHVFYTNTSLPRVDGVDIGELLARWGVEVVTVPITWRLPRGAVGLWGNQFYVFDAIRHFVEAGTSDRLILLDSDCLWLKDAAAIEDAIDSHGALTYLLGEDEHGAESEINGLSRAGMARFLNAHGGERLPETPYYGGEIYAANRETSRKILAHAEALWPAVIARAPDAPREEAHLLSIAYALERIEAGTADPFIRRMWTTFHHNNLRPRDADLAIWHLPAEKRTGFKDMYSRIVSRPGLDPARDGAALGLEQETYARLMGFPRRGAGKFVRDLSLKVREKLGA